jgi:hypothetical protein
MPRFSTKTVLIAVAFIALWLSACIDVYEGGDDVRRSLKLLITVASALAAYCFDGRQRVFWLGFAAIWLLTILSNPNSVPLFFGIQHLIDFYFSQRYHSSISDTVRTSGITVLATIAGLIGLYIFDHRK